MCNKEFALVFLESSCYDSVKLNWVKNGAQWA